MHGSCPRPLPATRVWLQANGLYSWARLGALLSIFLAGMWLACRAASSLRHDAEHSARVDAEHAVGERVKVLRSQILRSMEILHSITSFFETEPPVSRAQFQRFVKPSLERQPEVKALEWIPRVSAEERDEYERRAQMDGLIESGFTEIAENGRVIRAGSRAEYFPVYYAEPAATNRALLGLDLSVNSISREAFDRAAHTGEPAATGPLQPFQSAENRPGFLVVAPVFNDRVTPTGFALAVFGFPDLVGPTLAPLGYNGLRVEVRDVAAPETLLFSAGERSDAAPQWHAEESLAVAGRVWRLEFEPGRTFVVPTPGWIGYATPATIALGTILLCAYLLSWVRRTAAIERKVTEKTAEITREVRVRERAELAMRAAEAKYHSIFENAIDGIFQTTVDGRYLSANPALAKIYGYESPAELLASFSDIGAQLYVEPHRREEFVREVRAHGTVSDFISQVHRKDGAAIWICEKAMAIRAGDGEILYFEGIVEDVTERVRDAETLKRSNELLEERVALRTGELDQAVRALNHEILVRKRAEESADRANRAKSLFLADMSHEIRTPLNAILGYTQLLQRDAQFAKQHPDALRAIREGGNHLMCLVDGVLDLTKIEVGRMELAPVDFDLNLLVQGLASMFSQRCQQKSLRLRVENVGTTACWLHGDERKLRQVLVNLLSNAVKFTDTGEVRLRVASVDFGPIYRFEVIDTGPGITQSAQAAIFEPFKQEVEGRAKGGTGLGLSIAHRLIGLMGGLLELKSEPGKGSTFHFAVALEPALTVIPSHAAEPTAELRLAPECRVRALVVDDTVTNGEILARMLRAFGCEVTVAENGPAGIDAFRANLMDIVFIDLRMPGMHGSSVAAALRSTAVARTPKLVAYSASAWEHEYEQAQRAGFDEFLPKPFRFERVGECLVSLLNVRMVGVASPAATATSNEGGIFTFSEDVLVSLRTAAEIGDFTEFSRLLDEMEMGGCARGELLRRLRHLANTFDTQALLSDLNELSGAFVSTT